MKSYRTLLMLVAGSLLLSGASVLAKTCCEKAFAEKKECKNRCCIAAHREKRSCLKCNPGREDLKIIEKEAAAKQQARK